MSYSIAIDGPAGAGKSTIAKLIAKKKGYIYVDTGAMYRAMALYFIESGISSEDSAAISAASKDVDVTIKYENGEQIVFLNGRNVNGRIRQEEVGKMASCSSANKDVREKLVELQRALANKESVVMDGRDIGTYVLPNANLKIFQIADLVKRAERRYIENIENLPTALDDIIKNRKQIEVAAGFLSKHKSFPIVGYNYYSALAIEGALKIKETSYCDANAYPVGEFLHGHTVHEYYLS